MLHDQDAAVHTSIANGSYCEFGGIKGNRMDRALGRADQATRKWATERMRIISPGRREEWNKQVYRI